MVESKSCTQLAKQSVSADMFEKTPYALGMYKRGSPDLILLRSSLNSEATVRKSLPQLLGPMPFAGTTRWRRMPLPLLAPRHLCERDRASRYPHSDLRSSRRSVKKQSRILRSPSLDLPHKANKNAPMQHRSMSGRELSASAASKSSASVTRRGPCPSLLRLLQTGLP